MGRMTKTDELTLAADFPQATYEDWRKLVDGVLKGAPFEKLVSKTSDGLKIDPIYRRAQGAAPVAGRAAAAPWQIMQRIDHPDAKAANAQALHDLENGATGLTLVFAGANGAHGFGLDPSAEAVAQVLDGIYLDAGIGIELQIGPQSRMAAIHLAEYIKRKGIDPAACDIRFGLDPLGSCAVWGSSPYSWDEIVPAVTGAIKGLAAMGFKGPLAAADGRVIHDAGGSEVQELAFVLAAGVAYLRAIEQAGIALEDAQGMVYARLSADADQFLTLAKFRALRLLWARIEQACGLTPKPLFIAADTAWRMLTQRDALREHAARDDGDLLRRSRRRQRHHRVAAHAGAGIARSVRAACRAQHATGAAGRIQPRQGERSRSRLRRHRNIDQTALRSRMVAVSGDRKGRRHLRRARTKPDPAQGRRNPRCPRGQYRQATRRADGRERISEPA